MSERDYQKKLAEDRKNNPGTKNRENDPEPKKRNNLRNSMVKTQSTVRNIFNMPGQIQINDILFVFPLILAILKDISDIFLIGSIWGLGTVISLCCSIMGGLYIWLIGAGNARRKAKGIFNGTMKRFLVLFGGTTIEIFGMGINFLPVQTITFILMYLMLLYERVKCQQEKIEEKKQITNLNEQYA